VDDPLLKKPRLLMAMVGFEGLVGGGDAWKAGLAQSRRKWLAAMIYGVWQERNARIFKGCVAPPVEVLRAIERSR
ncbi:hypothetical protein Dimus_005798, partial [Dionaea muscipula]